MSRVGAVAVGFVALGIGAGGARGDEAERKAVGYLAAEVPRWARENHCYACHNNGDAARALFRARAAGLSVERASIDDTLRWLSRPDGWEKNGGEGPSSDKALARVEFASALATAIETGLSDDRGALRRAADFLAADQAEDGSWPIDDGGLVGSPATYGPRLATALAARVMERADPVRYDRAIDRARTWVRSGRPVGTLDAASVLLVEPAGMLSTSESARRAIGFLLDSRARSGGWGPFQDRPTEPFDTALALLALARHRDLPGVSAVVASGRSALVAMQRDDGSWPETTRPPGGESYAQRLSTSGWATLALIESRP